MDYFLMSRQNERSVKRFNFSCFSSCFSFWLFVFQLLFILFVRYTIFVIIIKSNLQSRLPYIFTKTHSSWTFPQVMLILKNNPFERFLLLPSLKINKWINNWSWDFSSSIGQVVSYWELGFQTELEKSLISPP